MNLTLNNGLDIFPVHVLFDPTYSVQLYISTLKTRRESSWSQHRCQWWYRRLSCRHNMQGWGQIRFIKYKYKYKYFFSGVSNTNTNTNTPAKILSNTNTNTNTAHQIQIQIHNEAGTKLPPFYRWHIQIHCIVRTLFYLFKFHWKLFPKVQSTISLHWFR